ncbi:MAG TPA: hypothetical protein VF025_01320 [Gaiellaceae bacterium]
MQSFTRTTAFLPGPKANTLKSVTGPDHSGASSVTSTATRSPASISLPSATSPPCGIATHFAAVHPPGGLPAGQIYHAAGPSADGWTIVAIHDSQESWESFRDGILMPRMQQGIDGGFGEPPAETTFPVHNQESA